jgi:hypothetical protein
VASICELLLLSSTLSGEWLWVDPVRDAGVWDRVQNRKVLSIQAGVLLLGGLAIGVGLALPMAAAGHPTGYNFHSWIVAGGPGDDQATGVAIDAQDRLHVAGSFEASAGFGSTNVVSAGKSDAFLARYDDRGALLWVRTFASPEAAVATAVAADPDGHSLVAGHFQGNLDAGATTLTNRGSYDGFVAKLDPDGNLLWTVQVGGLFDDRVNALAVDAEGDAYLAGHFMDTVDFGVTNLTSTGRFPDIFVARISRSGQVLWVAQGGGPLPDDAFGLAVDAAGNSVVVGTVAGTNTFGSLTLSNAAEAQILVAACDSHGEFLWARSGGSGRPDSALAVALGPDGSATVSGVLGGPASLGDLNLTNDAARYTFTARYTAGGTLDWLVDHGGQETRALTVTAHGEAIVTGWFTGTQRFGDQLLSSTGAFDWFILGHDPFGTIQWARKAGGPQMDYVYGLAAGRGADLWLAGRGTTTATFDDLVLTNAQGFDLLVTKFSPAPLLRESPLPVVTRSGNPVTLRAAAVGAEPLGYQWYRDHTEPVPDGTEPALVLDPALPEHSGIYSVTVTNGFGAATSDPVMVTVFGLPAPEVEINGERGTNFHFVDVSAVLVTLSSAEPDLDFYYTLDGSQPSFGSTPYLEPFELRRSAVVRAVAYAADLASAESEPVTLTLILSPPLVTVDGQTGSHISFTNAVSVQVILQAGLDDVSIFYTLDDSTPTTQSSPYLGPFALTAGSVVRALAFSPDLGSAAADPVSVLFLRTHTLMILPPSDGSVTVDPPGGEYLEGTAVQLTAAAAAGWEFLRWTGDVDGTEPAVTLVLDGPKTASADFGTALEIVTDGSGTVQLNPAQPLFPRGARLTAAAQPDPGFFFARWSGAATGTNSAVEIVVTNANPVLVASFSPLPPHAFTLTIRTNGRGSVDLDPDAPFYTAGTAVRLTAMPEPEAAFLAWTGDQVTSANPLTLLVTSHQALTANFSGAGFLYLEVPESTGDGQWQIRVLGDPGAELLLQTSVDFNAVPAWLDQFGFTNVTGSHLITIPAQSHAGPALFRVVAPEQTSPAP